MLGLFEECFAVKDVRELSVLMFVVILVEGKPYFDGPLHPFVLLYFFDPVIALKGGVL